MNYRFGAVSKVPTKTIISPSATVSRMSTDFPKKAFISRTLLISNSNFSNFTTLPVHPDNETLQNLRTFFTGNHDHVLNDHTELERLGAVVGGIDA
jgi:hypothetical protein